MTSKRSENASQLFTKDVSQGHAQDVGDGSAWIEGNKADVTQYDFTGFKGAPKRDVWNTDSEAAANQYHTELKKYLEDNKLSYYVRPEGKAGFTHWVETADGKLVGKEQFFKNDDNFMQVFAPVASAFFLPVLGSSLAAATGLSTGVANAAVGGAFSAAAGGNPKNIITNALLTQGLAQVPGMSSLPAPVQGAVTGGIRSAVTGGNPLQGLLQGIIGRQNNPAMNLLTKLLIGRVR